MSNVRTGGGLLASIAALRPQACVTALWTEGYAGRAIVGCVEPRSASLAAITVEFDEVRHAPENSHHIPMPPRQDRREEMAHAHQSVL